MLNWTTTITKRVTHILAKSDELTFTLAHAVIKSTLNANGKPEADGNIATMPITLK